VAIHVCLRIPSVARILMTSNFSVVLIARVAVTRALLLGPSVVRPAKVINIRQQTETSALPICRSLAILALTARFSIAGSIQRAVVTSALEQVVSAATTSTATPSRAGPELAAVGILAQAWAANAAMSMVSCFLSDWRLIALESPERLVLEYTRGDHLSNDRSRGLRGLAVQIFVAFAERI